MTSSNIPADIAGQGPDEEGDGLLLACMDDGLLSREWESMLGQPSMTAVQAEFFHALTREMAFRLWRKSTAPKDGAS